MGDFTEKEFKDELRRRIAAVKEQQSVTSDHHAGFLDGRQQELESLLDWIEAGR